MRGPIRTVTRRRFAAVVSLLAVVLTGGVANADD